MGEVRKVGEPPTSSWRVEEPGLPTLSLEPDAPTLVAVP